MKSLRTAKPWQQALSYLLMLLLIEPWPLFLAYADYVDETVTRLPVDADDSYAFAVGDVDGDGTLDLLLGNGGQSRLLLNDGNGNYSDVTATQLPAVLHTTVDVALADFDGANGPDALLIGIGQNRLLMNDGSGNFTDETAIRLPVANDLGMSVDVADIDADADLDLVIANRGSRNQVWINNGAGVFTDESNGRLPADADPSYDVVLTDVNGDGSPDLFVANKNRQDRLFINNRLGVFSDVTATALPAAITVSNGADAADMDGDGDNDLVIADGDSGVRVLFNADGAGGTFTPASLPVLDAYGVKVAAGDVDFDGSNDIILGAMGPDSVLLNDGSGSFTDASATQLPGSGERTFGLAAADTDDDLDLDLLIATPQGQNRYLNNVIEAPRAAISVTPDYIEATDTAFITVQTADEDGIASVLVEIIQPDTTVAAATDLGNGDYSFATTQIGLHTIRVTAEDSLTNSSVTLKSFLAQENDVLNPVIQSLTVVPSAITQGQSTLITVTATDDRGVTSTTVTVGGVNVPLDANGQANFTPSAVGSLAVIATASDAAGNSDTDSTTLVVGADNVPPSVSLDISPDPQDITNPFTVQATATDDIVLTSFNVSVTGPGGTPTDEPVSLNGAGIGSYTPYLPGTYIFTATAVDGGGNTTNEVVNVEAVGIPDAEAPVVTLTVAPGTTVAGGSATVTVDATDNVFVASRTLTFNGAPIALDAQNQGVVNTPVLGAYTIEATATDPSGNVGTDTYVLMAVDPASDTTAPTVDITSPADDAVVTSQVDIVGTAEDTSLVNYELQYRQVGTNDFSTFASNGISVNNGVLGTLDPTMLENGTYEIRLIAEDINGLISFIDTVISVEGALKLGHFSVDFLDKALNIGKLPIDVSRGYDSRNKDVVGDFGYGWNITTNSATLQENRSPSGDWDQINSGGFIPTYNIVPTRPHTATIRMGQFETKFRARPNPDQQQLQPIQFLNSMNYEPLDSNENGTLVPNQQPFFFIGNEATMDDLSPYNPSVFTYTAEDGYQYRFSGLGLRHELSSVTDPAGTTITFGANGFSRSDGLGLTFTRDAQGRITRMTDPNGNEVEYSYDAIGDLVAVTNGAGATTTFVYDANHFLLEIRDPTGAPLQRQEYDEDGRLIAMTDGEGNRIEMEYDLDNNTQILRDRRGNPTIYEYDELGNITRETSFPEVDGVATQVVVNRQFDADSNLTEEIDGNGVINQFTYNADSSVLTETRDVGGLALQNTFTYDAGGRVLTQTDPRGNIITNTYTAEGYLASRLERGGALTLYEYDAAGNRTRVTDALGQYTVFEYDSLGNMTAQERFDTADVSQQRRVFTYDANGNMLTDTTLVTVNSVVTPLTTSFTYDGADQLLTTTDPRGNTRSVEYDSLGRKIADIDAMSTGNRTEYTFNQADKITRIDYADGSAQVYDYDPDGNRIAETNRDGNITLFDYDPLDRITRVEFADTQSKQMRYDASGNLIAEIDENGNRTDYTYDNVKRRLTTLEPEVFDTVTGSLIRPVTTYEYDANGNRTAVVDANGRRTEFEYDEEDRLTLTRYADGSTSESLYDPLGREIRKQDPAGNAMIYEYDALDRMTLSRLPRPSGSDPFPDTVLAYDEAGRKISQTDPNGNVTTWEYDGANNVTARELPEGQRETFTYDEENRVATHTDFNGDVTTFSYDEVGREVLREFDDGSTVATTYGGSGRTESITDARGLTTYGFDARSRLISKNGPDGVLAYTYTPSGEKATVTSAAGTITYSYDALNRLETMTDQDGDVTTYGYDAVGNLTRTQHANGSLATQTYNNRNQLTALVNERADTTVFSSYSYTLNANGLRTSVTELDGSEVTYTYDDNYRLTRETRTGANPYDTLYTYDGAGNRLSADRDGAVTTYTYDDNDRLLSENAITYTYDANGNRTSKTDGGVTTTYGYDFQNRLVTTTTSGVETRYVYDAQHNRVQQTDGVGNVQTSYVVDPFHISGVAQVIEEYDGTGTLTVSYAVGHQRASQNRSGSEAYYHYDGSGNTRLLSNAAEAITDQYLYDAFGRELATVGTTVNTFRFAGEQFDSILDLYYMRARYYDQSNGLFVSMDPFMGDPQSPQSLHRYLYAANNPVNFVDPTGKFTLVSISISISINTNIQSAYTSNLAKLFITAMRIAFCQLKPAYKMQAIAIDMIARDLPGGIELYLQAQTQIAAGFKALAQAIADTYQAIADDLNPLSIEIEGALVDLYNALTSEDPLSALAGQILPFVGALSTWLDRYANAMAAVDAVNSADECDDFKWLEENADFVIGLIPGL